MTNPSLIQRLNAASDPNNPTPIGELWRLCEEAASALSKMEEGKGGIVPKGLPLSPDDLAKVFAETQYMVPEVRAWAIEHAIGIWKAMYAWRYEQQDRAFPQRRKT